MYNFILTIDHVYYPQGYKKKYDIHSYKINCKWHQEVWYRELTKEGKYVGHCSFFLMQTDYWGIIYNILWVVSFINLQHFKRFHWPIQNCWTAKGEVNIRPRSNFGGIKSPFVDKCILIYWNILWNWMKIKSERYSKIIVYLVSLQNAFCGAPFPNIRGKGLAG